ncbi:MAG: Ig-like domain-containing protein [Candidatus Eisenbacteria bacterium]
MTTPVRGALVTGTFEIEVEPADPRAPIDRVDFLIDGLPIGSARSAPSS